MTYKLLFQKKYLPKQIQIQHVQTKRNTDPFIEEQIEKEWQVLLEKNPTIFNGLCYRLIEFSAIDTLSLVLSTITYKEAKGIPTNYVFDTYGPENLSRAFCCSILLETSDHYVIFGKKDIKERIIGGSYAPEELKIINSQDLYTMAKIEVHEETGIAPEYIKTLDIVGGVQTSNQNIALVFSGTTELSRAEIIECFDVHHDPEFDSLVFIEKERLVEYFQSVHPEKDPLLRCII